MSLPNFMTNAIREHRKDVTDENAVQNLNRMFSFFRVSFAFFAMMVFAVANMALSGDAAIISEWAVFAWFGIALINATVHALAFWKVFEPDAGSQIQEVES